MGPVLASLIRIPGDLDSAEEALQEAFSAAMEQWPKEGIPKNPYSWLVSVGKFKAIDSIRRSGRKVCGMSTVEIARAYLQAQGKTIFERNLPGKLFF